MSELQETSAFGEQIKKDLLNPRTVSKNFDPEGRQATAGAIRQARNEQGSTQAAIDQVKVEDKRNLAQYEGLIGRREQKVAEIAERTQNTLVRLKSLLGLGDRKLADLLAELTSSQKELETHEGKSTDIDKALMVLEKAQKEIPKPQELLEAYYEKIQTKPLTQKEKRELLTPEVLASLSLEEYIALWRRLNPYFLSHVTRQGFRDHNAMVYHSAGLQEFHNGFVKILEDERTLRPPLAVKGLKARDETSVKIFLSSFVLQAPDEITAQKRLNDILNFSLVAAPSYPDRTAVHFAKGKVVNSFYGGEVGNEIFFLYPTDVIASQYDFSFNEFEHTLTERPNEGKWNDVFVWPSSLDNPGISIDSGIVFLPANTLVDPKTGSKYASGSKNVEGEERKVFVEDTALVSAVLEWTKSLASQARFEQSRKYLEEESGKSSLSGMCVASARDIQKRLESLGFGTGAAEDLACELTDGLVWGWNWNDEDSNTRFVQEALTASNARWKRPENTISSKDYWESHFEANPQLRPKHIVYYDGNPTDAVLEFQQKNNIGRADTSATDGALLGFDDHHIADMTKDPRSFRGYEELVDTANRIISEHYQSIP